MDTFPGVVCGNRPDNHRLIPEYSTCRALLVSTFEQIYKMYACLRDGRISTLPRHLTEAKETYLLNTFLPGEHPLFEVSPYLLRHSKLFSGEYWSQHRLSGHANFVTFNFESCCPKTLNLAHAASPFPVALEIEEFFFQVWENSRHYNIVFFIFEGCNIPFSVSWVSHVGCLLLFRTCRVGTSAPLYRFVHNNSCLNTIFPDRTTGKFWKSTR